MCGGSFRQAAQPGYGHAWKRDTGLLLSAVLGAGCAPRDTAFVGFALRCHPCSIFSMLSVEVSAEAAYKHGLDTPSAPSQSLAADETTPSAEGRAGGGAAPLPPAATAQPARRLVRLPGVSAQDAPACRPTPRGWGTAGERAPRPAAPSSPPPPRGRAACAEAGLPLPFAVTSARDSLQRAEEAREGAGCSPWRSPLGGRGAVLAVAAVWPCRRHHVSAPQPLRARGRRGRDGRPQATAAPPPHPQPPTSVPGAEALGEGEGGRLPAARGGLSLPARRSGRRAAPLTPSASLRAVGRSEYPAPPPPPAPPRKGEADCRTDVASSPAAFPRSRLR